MDAANKNPQTSNQIPNIGDMLLDFECSCPHVAASLPGYSQYSPCNFSTTFRNHTSAIPKKKKHLNKNYLLNNGENMAAVALFKTASVCTEQAMVFVFIKTSLSIQTRTSGSYELSIFTSFMFMLMKILHFVGDR